MLDDSIPSFLYVELAELISMSQDAIRSFEATNIYNGLKIISPDTATQDDAMIFQICLSLY